MEPYQLHTRYRIAPIRIWLPPAQRLDVFPADILRTYAVLHRNREAVLDEIIERIRLTKKPILTRGRAAEDGHFHLDAGARLPDTSGTDPAKPLARPRCRNHLSATLSAMRKCQQLRTSMRMASACACRTSLEIFCMTANAAGPRPSERERRRSISEAAQLRRAIRRYQCAVVRRKRIFPLRPRAYALAREVLSETELGRIPYRCSRSSGRQPNDPDWQPLPR